MAIVNPRISKLGLRAYTNFMSYDDDRGTFDIWFQPPLALLNEIHDAQMSVQIQQASILPGYSRGHHLHPYEKAVDCFYLEAGDGAILGLESADLGIQEVYHLRPRTVCVFPPFVAHAVWNRGSDVVRFTTFRTWNYAIDPCVISHQVDLGEEILAEALRAHLDCPHGLFGFSAPATTQVKAKP